MQLSFFDRINRRYRMLFRKSWSITTDSMLFTWNQLTYETGAIPLHSLIFASSAESVGENTKPYTFKHYPKGFFLENRPDFSRYDIWINET